MSMLKAPRSAAHERKEELREDQLATATFRARSFYEENERAVQIAAAVLGLLIVGIVGWKWWTERQDVRAAEALGGVLTAYEQGNYQEALEGVDGRPGLLAIADRYGATDTGNLATFFAADALYQLGRYDDAARYFAQYDADEDLLGASALAAQAGLREQRGEWAEAGALYLRAAETYPAPATAPDYLMAAAGTFEAAGDLDRARETLRGLVESEEYEESAVLTRAEVELARLDAMAAAGVRPARRPAPPPPAPPAAEPAPAMPPNLFPGAAGPLQTTPGATVTPVPQPVSPSPQPAAPAPDVAPPPAAE
jgi:predicted negative regulator of RcsB-dependent stress response